MLQIYALQPHLNLNKCNDLELIGRNPCISVVDNPPSPRSENNTFRWLEVKSGDASDDGENTSTTPEKASHASSSEDGQ